MINILTNRQDPVHIGDLELEATLTENHEFVNDITNYPVEEGYDITDHVKQKPEVITINALFSRDSMPSRVGNLEFYIRGWGKDRVQSALERLMFIAGYSLPKQVGQTIIVEKAGPPQLVDIISTIRIYTNMMCSSLTIPTSSQNGQSLKFTIGFKKISTVSSKIVSLDNVSTLNDKAPNVESQAPKPKNAGTKPTKDVPADSTMYNLIGEEVKKKREALERFLGL